MSSLLENGLSSLFFAFCYHYSIGLNAILMFGRLPAFMIKKWHRRFWYFLILNLVICILTDIYLVNRAVSLFIKSVSIAKGKIGKNEPKPYFLLNSALTYLFSHGNFKKWTLNLNIKQNLNIWFLRKTLDK